jgi:hypothetical protein
MVWGVSVRKHRGDALGRGETGTTETQSVYGYPRAPAAGPVRIHQCLLVAARDLRGLSRPR